MIRRAQLSQSLLHYLHGAAMGLISAMLSGCVTPARLLALDEVAASAPDPLHAANRELPLGRSRAILETLARQAGVNNSLLHHVAVEDMVSDSPLVVGNRVTLLRDGPATYRSMYHEISRAKHHINLEVYIFEQDELGKQLIALLLAQQRRGIQVNVIYDAVGSAHTTPRFFEPLKRAGGRVLQFNPLNPTKARSAWQVDHRDHRKLLIVDGQIAFTGGINFSSVYSSGPLSHPQRARPPSHVPYRDTHVKIEGPVVIEFQKLFLATWSKQHGEPLPPARYLPIVRPKANELVRAVGSTPDDGVSVIHTALLSAIAHAQRSVHVTNAYFVPDRRLIEQIKRAAQRGIDVRIILPGQSDFWAPLYAGRALYTELLDAGVKIYERRAALLHAKTMVVDQVWSTVGSANLDWRSFLNNDEVNAVVLGGDFAAQMEAMFLADLAHSREITKEAWKRRGINSRIKEMAASIWQRWL